jgi:phospholipid-binding lipoprotein MlaA
VLCLVLGGAARAAAPDPLFDDTEASLGFPDPLEPVNRVSFALNRGIDRTVIDPLSRLYRWAVPGEIRLCVRRFFANLNSPSIVANDVLQREWRAAGVTTARTGINTVLGLAGFFDPATELGFPGHQADFGQTLALAGVPSGPYLVVPLLGPTDVRDGLGALVDFAFRPTTYMFGSTLLGGLPGVRDQLFYSSLQGGSTGLVKRAAAQPELDALRESSVDYYATLRVAFSQARVGTIWEGREQHKAIREHALFIRRCQTSTPRLSRAGRWTSRRILPASERRCSPHAAAPAR